MVLPAAVEDETADRGSMKFQDYRTSFQVVSLVVVLLVAFPAINLFAPFPRGGERFSELWLLGPNHLAEDYPFNVRADEEYQVFVGVGNHLGSSAYYQVCSKFRNQTQPLPNATSSVPSPLPSVHTFQFLVGDEEVHEVPITFRMLNVSAQSDEVVVENVEVNRQVFRVDSSSTWDPENGGFYSQLFFELWLYDTGESRFRFHDRFVGLWLNMTG